MSSVELKELFSSAARNRNQTIEIVLLYDSSGSVSSRDFQLSVTAGSQLVQSFGNNVSFAFGQFSSAFHLGYPLSNDKQVVAQKHKEMKRVSGGTNTTDALQKAECLFSKSCQLKFIYLFTDGHPNNQQTCTTIGNQIRQRGIKVIGVGIGNGVSRNGLAQFCDIVFILNDYQELISAIPALPQADPVVPDSEIILGFNQSKKPISFTENLPLEITIRNIGRVVISKDARIEITPDHFYNKEFCYLDNEIKRGETCTIYTELQVTGKAKNDFLRYGTIHNLPQSINVKVYPDQSDLPYFSKVEGFCLDIENYLKDLFNFRLKAAPDTIANILVFGWVGAGKSSLINALLSTFFDKLQKFAAVLNSASHVTQKLEGFDLNAISQFSVNFKFLDTPGLSMDTYCSKSFAEILENIEVASTKDILNNNNNTQFQRDTSSSNSNNNSADGEDNVIKFDYNNLIDNYGKSVSKQVHSVLLVLPQASREDPIALARMKYFVMELVTKHKISPILIITRIDEVPELEKRDAIRNQFYTGVGVEHSRIFLVDNASQIEKSFLKDKLMIDILIQALRAADQFLIAKSKLPNSNTINNLINNNDDYTYQNQNQNQYQNEYQSQNQYQNQYQYQNQNQNEYQPQNQYQYQNQNQNQYQPQYQYQNQNEYQPPQNQYQNQYQNEYQPQNQYQNHNQYQNQNQNQYQPQYQNNNFQIPQNNYNSYANQQNQSVAGFQVTNYSYQNPK